MPTGAVGIGDDSGSVCSEMNHVMRTNFVRSRY